MASHGVPRAAAPAPDKSERDKEKERRHIQQYKALEKEVHAKIAATDYSNTTLLLTARLLTQNPEYYTIWNYRRVLLEHVFAAELAPSPPPAGDITNATTIPTEADQVAAAKAGLTTAQREIHLLIAEDLQFQLPLLKQWPKCYWIWNHRRWLLATATRHLPTHSTLGLWRNELGLVTKMLALDSRNFHGWGYRREVVANLQSLSGESMCEQEFEYSTKMIQSNLSNFSAWHMRGQLLPRLLDERAADAQARKKLYDGEFELITNALYTDPYDQSLWFYHQYLMSALDETNSKRPVLLESVEDAERAHYFNRELDSVRDMLDGAEDCKYIYQALLDYAKRYLERDAKSGKVTMVEMQGWLEELKKIDPLRKGRWEDLARSLKL